MSMQRSWLARALTSFAIIRERLSLVLFLLVVIAAPLPLGSTDIWIVAFWNVLLGLSLILLPLRQLGGAQLSIVLAVALGVCAFALALHEQVSAFPWFAGGLVSPVWKDVSALPGIETPAIVSIARNQPFLAMGSGLACIVSLMCSFILCQDRKIALVVYWTLAIAGAAYVLVSISSFVIDPTTILGQPKEAYQSVLTGTFINRNTAAAYFGSCAILWLSLMCERIKQRLLTDIEDRAMVLDSLRRPSLDAVALFIIFVATTVALFMTASRAGTTLSLAAFTITVWSHFPRRFGSRSMRWLAFGAVVMAAVALWQVMGSGVADRLESQGIVDEGRWQAYKSSLHMISDYPWLGTGLGTFSWIFPSYRSPMISAWGVWDRAHNTLIEIAVEMGIPIATLVLSGWIAAIAVLFRATRIRRRDRIFPCAAFAVALLAGSHSLVDFPLQIPGNAIVVFAIVGMGLAQSFATQRKFHFEDTISV